MEENNACAANPNENLTVGGYGAIIGAKKEVSVLNVKEKIMAGGIIAIFRRLYEDDLHRVCDALYAGGIRVMEVTFDQSDAEGIDHTSAAIESLCRWHPDLTVGAGTVLETQQLLAARQAGATYMVAPNVDTALIAKCREWGMASMPGAMTPTEIAAAWQAGADLVKLFPAGYLGPEYVKHVHAPLGHIPLVATAGVTAENLPAFLRAGCVGAGISGPLMDKKCIAAGNFTELTARAEKLVRTFRENR